MLILLFEFCGLRKSFLSISSASHARDRASMKSKWGSYPTFHAHPTTKEASTQRRFLIRDYKPLSRVFAKPSSSFCNQTLLANFSMFCLRHSCRCRSAIYVHAGPGIRLFPEVVSDIRGR